MTIDSFAGDVMIDENISIEEQAAIYSFVVRINNIAYVTELDLINQSIIQSDVPTTIIPGYNSGKGKLASPVGTTVKYVQKSQYTIEFHFYIKKISPKKNEQLIHKIN